MSVTQAVWYSPTGKMYDVGQKHITFILDHPDLFGTTAEDLRAVFKKFKEPIGWEGKARSEIMLSAMRDGWTRIRYYATGNEGWTFEYFSGVVTSRHIREAMDTLLTEGKAHGDDNVHVHAFSDRNGEAVVVREDDYEFDVETHEGGVMQFLDSALVETLKEFFEKDRTLVESSRGNMPTKVYAREIPETGMKFAELRWDDGLGPMVLAVTESETVLFSRATGKLKHILSTDTDPSTVDSVKDHLGDGTIHWEKLNFRDVIGFKLS